MTYPVRDLVKNLLGVGFCGTTAALLSFFLRDSANVRFVAPVICLQVVIVVSLLWGRITGIVGSLVAVVIIVVFLFPPFGSVKITDPTELLMLLVLIVGSAGVFALIPRRSSGK